MLKWLAKKITEIQKSTLSGVDSRGGWYPWIREPTSGAWQANEEWTVQTVLGFPAVYACCTLISNDISKMPISLQQLDSDGIWNNVTDQSITPILINPNRYQNHIQFKQWWVMSLLNFGNTYVLKERDNRGNVVRLYILDPEKVCLLVGNDGTVFYQLARDTLNELEENSITVPASEIIHDRINCLFHPLIGISPLFAAGLAASHGLQVQKDSKDFFDNGSKPSGVLSAPGHIADETAARLKAHWEANYTGENAGKVAVLGDDLRFEQMRMSSTDSQLIEQLEWDGLAVCSAYHVPPYKVAVGPMPTHDNIEALILDYYSQALQPIIESMELTLAQGLGIELIDGRRIELGLDALIRMDSATLVDNLTKGIGGGLYTPNEGRKRANLKPLTGGDTVYLQQQNFSMEALAQRDSSEDPFSTGTSSGTAPDNDDQTNEVDSEDQARMLALLIEKEWDK